MNQKELIIKELLKSSDLASIKRRISKESKENCPSNIALLKEYHDLVNKKRIKKNERIEKILRTRPVRSLSGVVNISVLTKPYECPGKCIYCPKEENIPKSYLSGEPAVERAKKLKYNPYTQIKKRIESLEMAGHPTDKIDLRLIGGTWSSYPTKYKIWFIKRCFEACNNKKDKTLQLAQKRNETAKNRIIGISFETRPDLINEKEIIQMRELGATKIELGVQSIYDDVLLFNKRGHLVDETIRATKMLRNAGFKVAYQMMLNLPKSNPKRDIQMFEELFSNENFKPDYLKIYPCALVKEAPLYKLYLKGEYKPYTKDILIKTIKEIKKIVPKYVRIERIIRDIPSPLIVEGGAKSSNLRQEIDRIIKKEGWSCNCIRCREVKNIETKEKARLKRYNYIASQGKEIFLTFENKNLYSILRLRIPDKNVLPFLKDSALIREVHVYGQATPISELRGTQHKGLGTLMIKEAERIVKKEFGIKKISIISGVGVRDYYRKKLGYKLKDTYMTKSF
ncbi:MAG: tRNA uridine(34) 5-carboxymethylaminomethyl modification radical SAM/GNAT enzyme Elp3 [Candidatus Pacebacteria bacterium]|nr:tRNA uridine(34) 5-carboxymethylaminomethyl modification radical SAM/GNAT enzyme Elp3 [Candidatus Paceibacterota bacterium]